MSKLDLERSLGRLSAVAGSSDKSVATFDGSEAVFSQSGSLYCSVPLPILEMSDPAVFEVPLKPLLSIVQNAEDYEDVRLRLSSGVCRVAQSQFDLGVPCLMREGHIPSLVADEELPVSPKQLAESLRFALSFSQDASGYIEYSVAELLEGTLYAYDGVKACARKILDDTFSFPIQHSALKALEKFFRSSSEDKAYFKETENLRSFSDGKGWVAFRKDRRSVSQKVKSCLEESEGELTLGLSPLLRSLRRLSCVATGPSRKLTVEGGAKIKLSLQSPLGILSMEEIPLNQEVSPFSVTLDLKELLSTAISLEKLGASEVLLRDCSERGFLKISTAEAKTFVGVMRA